MEKIARQTKDDVIKSFIANKDNETKQLASKIENQQRFLYSKGVVIACNLAGIILDNNSISNNKDRKRLQSFKADCIGYVTVENINYFTDVNIKRAIQSLTREISNLKFLNNFCVDKTTNVTLEISIEKLKDLSKTLDIDAKI